MNKTVTVEGVCTPVAGPDDDFLYFIDSVHPSHIGVCTLAKQAGAEAINMLLLSAFRYERAAEQYSGGDRAKERQAYRATASRKYPPLYQVKVSVMVAAVPDDEAERLWNQEADRHARK